ncbi:hypothetical protein COBT_002681 [Conglomerata obtusa]
MLTLILSLYISVKASAIVRYDKKHQDANAAIQSNSTHGGKKMSIFSKGAFFDSIKRKFYRGVNMKTIDESKCVANYFGELNNTNIVLQNLEKKREQDDPIVQKIISDMSPKSLMKKSKIYNVDKNYMKENKNKLILKKTVNDKQDLNEIIIQSLCYTKNKNSIIIPDKDLNAVRVEQMKNNLCLNDDANFLARSKIASKNIDIKMQNRQETNVKTSQDNVLHCKNLDAREEKHRSINDCNMGIVTYSDDSLDTKDDEKPEQSFNAKNKQIKTELDPSKILNALVRNNDQNTIKQCINSYDNTFRFAATENTKNDLINCTSRFTMVKYNLDSNNSNGKKDSCYFTYEKQDDATESNVYWDKNFQTIQDSNLIPINKECRSKSMSYIKNQFNELVNTNTVISKVSYDIDSNMTTFLVDTRPITIGMNFLCRNRVDMESGCLIGDNVEINIKLKDIKYILSRGICINDNVKLFDHALIDTGYNYKYEGKDLIVCKPKTHSISNLELEIHNLKIHESVLFHDKIKLCKNVSIGKNVIIHENVSIGNNVIIEDNVIIFSSVAVPCNTRIKSGSVIDSRYRFINSNYSYPKFFMYIDSNSYKLILRNYLHSYDCIYYYECKDMLGFLHKMCNLNNSIKHAKIIDFAIEEYQRRGNTGSFFIKDLNELLIYFKINMITCFSPQDFIKCKRREWR